MDCAQSPVEKMILVEGHKAHGVRAPAAYLGAGAEGFAIELVADLGAFLADADAEQGVARGIL